MELALLVYAISLLPAIDAAAAVMTMLMIATLAIGLIINGDTIFNISGKFVKADLPLITRIYINWLWIAIPLLLLSVMTKVLLPSEKTAYMMVGAYTAQRVAENPKVQEMSGKVIKIIDSKLDDYVNTAEKEITKKLSDAKQ